MRRNNVTNTTMQTTTVLPPGGQQAGAVPMQNVVIMPHYVTSQPVPQVWTNYASKSSLILGATQIAIGLLCILFNAVAIGAHSATAVVGHGIWGGLFFILTGAFGVMAGKLRTTCSIVTFMVLSILVAVIFVTFVLVLAAIGVAIDHDQGQKSAKAMDAVLLGLSLLEAVVAIWSSALGCSAVCCGRRSQSGIVMQQGPVMMNTGGTQVLYTTGTSYPQTGNMFQQQGIPSAVSQQQQFSSAPMTQVPQTTMTYPPQSIVTYPTQTILTYPNQPTTTYPPQYDANVPPPPYVPTAPQGGAAAAAGSCAPISPVVGEERKIAF